MSAAWGRRLVSIGGLLLVWQGLAASGLIPPQYFPGVPEVLRAAVELLSDPAFWRDELLSLLRAAAGLVLAVALALGLAIAAARWDWLGSALSPIVELFRSMPPAPLVPLAIFALGLGASLHLFIIVFACVWPVYVGATSALAVSEPVQVQSARSIGLTAAQILWRIRLPAALPEIFSALRLAAGVSLLAGIAAEMLAGRDGIGAQLYQSAFSLQTPQTFALLFVAGLNGLLFNQIVTWLRGRAIDWHEQLSAMAQT